MDESSSIRPENPHKHIRGKRGPYRKRIKYYTKIEKRFAQVYNIPWEAASSVLVDIFYYRKILGTSRDITSERQRVSLELKYHKYGLKISKSALSRWADKVARWRDEEDLRKKQGGIY